MRYKATADGCTTHTHDTRSSIDWADDVFALHASMFVVCAIESQTLLKLMQRAVCKWPSSQRQCLYRLRARNRRIGFAHVYAQSHSRGNGVPPSCADRIVVKEKKHSEWREHLHDEFMFRYSVALRRARAARIHIRNKIYFFRIESRVSGAAITNNHSNKRKICIFSKQ